MKNRIFAALSALVLLTPTVASAAPRTFKELADLIVTILDAGAGLLILTGIVVYFWGISTNILKMKDEGNQAFKAYFVWGIIAIFVMVSIWGIVDLLRNTLFGSSTYDPGSSQPSSFGSPADFPDFQD